MPALEKLDLTGEIVWLGRTTDRDATLRSTPISGATLSFAGLPGEDHAGETRRSCSRVAHLYDRGTDIRNTRQLSVLSEEELVATAAEMGVERLDPADVGASMVVRGIPDFTHLPPSTRLQAPSGATLVVDMENRPCHLPAKVIDETAPGKGAAFKAAARNRRGVTAWVERPGEIAIGDPLRLFVPAQPAWKGWSEAAMGKA
ncbi:MAG: sulfurase [Paracoccaceae bacterium]|nr:sulfurase [Paracoccaceae bacterium]